MWKRNGFGVDDDRRFIFSEIIIDGICVSFDFFFQSGKREEPQPQRENKQREKTFVDLCDLIETKNQKPNKYTRTQSQQRKKLVSTEFKQ